MPASPGSIRREREARQRHCPTMIVPAGNAGDAGIALQAGGE
jgi:hypothetical protein